jgi:hypothetical protein
VPGLKTNKQCPHVTSVRGVMNQAVPLFSLLSAVVITRSQIFRNGESRVSVTLRRSAALEASPSPTAPNDFRGRFRIESLPNDNTPMSSIPPFGERGNLGAFAAGFVWIRFFPAVAGLVVVFFVGVTLEGLFFFAFRELTFVVMEACRRRSI